MENLSSRVSWQDLKVSLSSKYSTLKIIESVSFPRIMMVHLFEKVHQSLLFIKDYMRNAGEVTYADAHKSR